MRVMTAMFALMWVQTLSGQNLLPDSPLAQYQASGGAVIEVVSVTGRGFPQALRIETPQPGLALGDADLGWTNAQTVRAGDRLKLTFWVRKTAPTDRFNLRARVSLDGAGFAPLLDTVFPVNSDVWTRYSFDAVSTSAFEPGALSLRFRHGLGPQVYELGGIEWTNRGPAPPLEATGDRVEPVGNLTRFSAYFDGAVGGGSAQLVSATGPGFDRAIQITTRGASTSIFGAAMSWIIERDFARNDVMLVSFYARRLEGVQPFVQAQAVVERNSGDFSKSLTLQIPVDSAEWRLFQVPFRMNNDYPAGSVAFRFQFGAGPQRFELGGITLLHYGARAALEQLPNNLTYPGRDNPNAPWRAAANASIEANRKAAVRILVRDASGEPLPDAQVTVQQLDHAFRFGSAVAASQLVSPGFDSDQYRSRIASHFTTSVLENDLKWPFFECTGCGFSKEQTRSAIAWLAEHDIGIRGHVLIWPSWRNSPTGLSTLAPDALRARIAERFRSVLTDAGIRGKLYHWDVLNEPFDNFDIQGRIDGVSGVPPSSGVLGNAEAIRWFEMARELEPGAGLFLNDYDQFESGNVNGAHVNYTMRFSNICSTMGLP